VIVRENVRQIEDYLQAADIGLFTSESEGFCLSILEAMCFVCPSIASQVGGIPEVIENKITGLRVPFGDTEKMALAAEDLIQNPARRETLGCPAQLRAQTHFSAKIIVPR
jgi:L-malate glycosyltransferase